jgi:cysteine synthase A
MECCNPAGTGKDRAVKHMLDVAEKQGILKPGMSIVEGTSGSTGIALAYQCNARGYSLQIVMPDDQALEKKKLLEKLGATVTIVPCCAIANKNHCVNQARKLAADLQGFFVNQFENTTNYEIHYLETGPEIWKECNGQLDAFIMSAGTGGTIAGVSRYVLHYCVLLVIFMFSLCFRWYFRFLKEQSPSIQIILADPEGSSLFNKVQHNVCYTHQQSERKIRKHRYDSIVEGVGLDRVTQNFEQALIDHAYQIPDQSLVTVAHWLLHHEGIFVGSSSALNIAATIKTILSNKQLIHNGSTVVTVCCDYGNRHLSRFWNEEYLTEYGLHWPTKEELEGMVALVGTDNPN